MSAPRPPMTQRTALAEAVRRWGQSAAVEDLGAKRATTPERRRAASAAIAEARAFVTRENRQLLKPLISELVGVAHGFRYSVGELYSLPGLGRGFRIHGQGDTWEDAFAKAGPK